MSPVSNYRGPLHAGNAIDVTPRSGEQRVTTGHLGLYYSITPAQPPDPAAPGQSFSERYQLQGAMPR